MNDKCDYKNFIMCDRAKDSGMIKFHQSKVEGFSATIPGSGLHIFFCPYCGSPLKPAFVGVDTADGPGIQKVIIVGGGAQRGKSYQQAMDLIKASEKINLNCSCIIGGDIQVNEKAMELLNISQGPVVTPIKMVEVIDIDPMMVKK